MFLIHSPLATIKKRYRVILFVGLLVAILSGGIRLLFSLEYRADAQVFIISKSRYGVDPYTTVKSAERVGDNLVQLVKTNDFYNKVMEQSGYNLDKTKFTNVSEKNKRKIWQEAVKTSVVYGTGMINISAYHTDQEQAKQYAGAVASALSSQGWQYVGGDVDIKIINDPVVTNWPVRPNIILNVILGFIAGVLVTGLSVLRKGDK